MRYYVGAKNTLDVILYIYSVIWLYGEFKTNQKFGVHSRAPSDSTSTVKLGSRR